MLKYVWVAAVAALPVSVGADSTLRRLDSPPLPICAAPLPQAAESGPDAPPVLVEGLGYAGIDPDTQDPLARAWFAQGVRQVWAFDEAEAIRAFAEAQQLAPDCALCFWGEAWARSPTINLVKRPDQFEQAARAAAMAATLGRALPPRDRALVEAMELRYGETVRGEAYAEAMEAAADRFRTDPAVQVLAADARMIVAGQRGVREGSRTQRLLERALRNNPNHTGAIHFYVHFTDWISKPALAEPYANRLARLAPAASHLIHMPSHTFYGVGRYREATATNIAAMAADRRYEQKVRPPASSYRSALYAHNIHFAIAGALMEGDAGTAREAADHFLKMYDRPETDSGLRHVIRSAAYHAYGLHAPLTVVLALPEPKGSDFAMIMRRYARGEALARAGDAQQVRAEAAAIAKLRSIGSLPLIGGDPKPAQLLAEIAQHVLEGRAAMLDSNHKAAEAFYRQAMALQLSGKFSADPPPWWYSIRRSLGAALLGGGNYQGARLHLLASLRQWPADPLALATLAKAEMALGYRRSAARSLARAKRRWVGNLELVPLASI